MEITIQVYATEAQRFVVMNPLSTSVVRTVDDFDACVSRNLGNYFRFVSSAGKVMKAEACRYLLQQAEKGEIKIE